MKKYTDIYEYKVISYKDNKKLKGVRKWKNVWVVVKPNEINENKSLDVHRIRIGDRSAQNAFASAQTIDHAIRFAVEGDQLLA